MSKPYTVTDTRRISTMRPAGGTRNTYRVWIETPNGSTGVVDIPESDWEPDRVREILEDEAATLDMAFTLE